MEGDKSDRSRFALLRTGRVSLSGKEDELPGFNEDGWFVDKKNCRFGYYPSHPTNLPISKGEYVLVVYRTNKFFVYFRFNLKRFDYGRE
ncbi:hypothetical protein CP995_17630 [Klebsiella pneumoniae]|nr:hypothetical protein CP995_17630 [Klebsiella pneumoniae]